VYHAADGNKLYDLINKIEVTIDVLSRENKTEYDIIQILDDISIWIDEHRKIIAEEYLPFASLAVGTAPLQLGAFIYGVFVGKIMEKNNLKINITSDSISEKKALSLVKNNSDSYIKLFEKIIKPKEGEDGKRKKPGK